MADKKMYLGDGVYFESAPYQVKIFTRDGDSVNNIIYLDENVADLLIEELQKWLKGEE